MSGRAPRRLLVDRIGVGIRVGVFYPNGFRTSEVYLTLERAVDVAKQLLELAVPLLKEQAKKKEAP